MKLNVGMNDVTAVQDQLRRQSGRKFDNENCLRCQITGANVSRNHINYSHSAKGGNPSLLMREGHP